ncbi:hypothetical protein D3C80_636120 [compost metagenome]
MDGQRQQARAGQSCREAGHEVDAPGAVRGFRCGVKPGQQGDGDDEPEAGCSQSRAGQIGPPPGDGVRVEVSENVGHLLVDARQKIGDAAGQLGFHAGVEAHPPAERAAEGHEGGVGR